MMDRNDFNKEKIDEKFPSDLYSKKITFRLKNTLDHKKDLFINFKDNDNLESFLNSLINFFSKTINSFDRKIKNSFKYNIKIENQKNNKKFSDNFVIKNNLLFFYNEIIKKINFFNLEKKNFEIKRSFTCEKKNEKSKHFLSFKKHLDFFSYLNLKCSSCNKNITYPDNYDLNTSFDEVEKQIFISKKVLLQKSDLKLEKKDSKLTGRSHTRNFLKGTFKKSQMENSKKNIKTKNSILRKNSYVFKNRTEENEFTYVGNIKKVHSKNCFEKINLNKNNFLDSIKIKKEIHNSCLIDIKKYKKNTSKKSIDYSISSSFSISKKKDFNKTKNKKNEKKINKKKIFNQIRKKSNLKKKLIERKIIKRKRLSDTLNLQSAKLLRNEINIIKNLNQKKKKFSYRELVLNHKKLYENKNDKKLNSRDMKEYGYLEFKKCSNVYKKKNFTDREKNKKNVLIDNFKRKIKRNDKGKRNLTISGGANKFEFFQRNSMLGQLNRENFE